MFKLFVDHKLCVLSHLLNTFNLIIRLTDDDITLLQLQSKTQINFHCQITRNFVNDHKIHILNN